MPKACDVAESALSLGCRKAAGFPSPMSPVRQPAILEKLDPSIRHRFLRKCKRQLLKPNERLFDQGLPHASTYLIESGLVRTFYLSPSGKEITLAYWSSGDLVGGPDFFGNQPHIWSAKAVKHSIVLAVGGTDLKQLTRQIPEIAESVIEALSFKIWWLSMLVQIHGTESVTQRLAHLLVLLSAMYGVEDEDGDEGIAIRHHFSQTDLAALVSASRQWVSMALGRLQQAGVIRTRRRQLIICDMEKLRRLNEEDL